MDVGKLLEEGRRFLSKLPRTGRFVVIGDNDTDGIISSHLFARYFHKKNPYTSIVIEIIGREELFSVLDEYPSYTPVILDITPDKSVESIDRRLYVIDHHPVTHVPTNVVMFNPHLLNVPYASRYNTGFLVFLLFRDDIVKANDLWKVAVSSFGDSSYDYLRPFFYGIDRKSVEIASHIVGSVDVERLGELLSALEESKYIDEFISNEELLSLKKEFEQTLLELVNTIDNYCYHCESGLMIVLLPEELARFKSAVATVYSKRHPDVIVAVGVKENNVYNFSLRFQNAEKRGIHLGKFAHNFSSLFGTKGGGHAPAAGVRVPLDRLDDFVVELRRFVLSS